MLYFSEISLILKQRKQVGTQKKIKGLHYHHHQWESNIRKIIETSNQYLTSRQRLLTNIEGTPFSKLGEADENQGIGSSVITHSKSRHLAMMNNLKKREEMWDPRFYLEHIPKYDPFKDKQYFKPNQLVQRNQIEFAPGRIRKKIEKDENIAGANDGESVKSIQSHQQNQRPPPHPYLQQQYPPGNQPKKLVSPSKDDGESNLKELFQQIKNMWESMEVPFHHREIFVHLCKQIPREKAIELISTELEDLKKGNSSVIECMKAVKGREQCLLQIEEEILNISKNNSPVSEQTLSKCSEYITHLRLLSINAVECIQSWRNYLMDFLQPPAPTKERQLMFTPYLFKEENYIVKMRSDSAFIKNSLLQDYFYFSERIEFKVDPFLLSITVNNESTDKQIQNISKNLKKRIQRCQEIMNQEILQIQEDQMIQRLNSKKQLGEQLKLKGVGGAPELIRKSSQNPKPIAKMIMNSGRSGNKESISPTKVPKIQYPQRRFRVESNVSKSSAQIKEYMVESSYDKVLKEESENQVPNSQSIPVQQQQQHSQPKKESQILQNTQTHENHILRDISQKPMSSAEKQKESKTNEGLLNGENKKQQKIPQNNNQNTQQTNLPSKSNAEKERQVPIESTKSPISQSIKQNQQAERVIQQNEPQQKTSADKNQNVQLYNNEKGIIETVELEEESLIQFTENYLKNIEDHIKNSVLSSASEIKKRLRNEHECGCLQFKKQGSEKGMAFYFNESSQQSRRITLMHISAIDKECLKEFLNEIIEYIFKHDPCDEIRLCLYHYENAEGKVAVNKEVQTIFTSKGFKWKQVNNDKYTCQRTTILALKRPQNIPVTVSIKQFDHLAVQSVALITAATKAPLQLIDTSHFDMTVNLLGGLEQAMQENKKFSELISASSDVRMQKYLEQINILMRKQYKYSDIKKEIFEDDLKLQEALKMYEINYKGPKAKEGQIFSSISKLALKWRAFNSCIINNQKYFRMNTPEEPEVTFMHANWGDQNNSLFILPTDDPSSNIFVFEIENEEDYKVNFDSKVKQIMKSLKNTKQFTQDVFVPSFSINRVSQGGINGEFEVNQSLEISTNYTQLLPNIKIKVPADSAQVVIKAPFVFGLVNSEVDDILEVPYYSALVGKRDCINA